MVTAIQLMVMPIRLGILLGVTAMATRLKPIGYMAAFEAREYYFLNINIDLEGNSVEYFGPKLP